MTVSGIAPIDTIKTGNGSKNVREIVAKIAEKNFLHNECRGIRFRLCQKTTRVLSVIMDIGEVPDGQTGVGTQNLGRCLILAAQTMFRHLTKGMRVMSSTIGISMLVLVTRTVTQ
jgi:hypothetical protein